MNDDNRPDTFHFDIYGVFPDGVSLLLGHGDLPSTTGTERYRALVDLLRQTADNFEKAANEYEQTLRTVVTPLGDSYYEVSTDKFVQAESREAAEKLANDKFMTMTYKQLTTLFPDLKESGK